jgi:glycine dehydrogenase subunit 2
MEPTETESKATLDQYCETVLAPARKAKSGGMAEEFASSPQLTPRRRLDETQAARKPILRWKPEPLKHAAE